MKFRITSVLVISLMLLVHCTDKELYKPIKKIYPDHCSNGIVDGDEVGVDCGGECVPCGTIVAPCNPDTNKITFDSTTSAVTCPNAVKTIVMSHDGVVDVNGNYKMYGNTISGGEYIDIILSGTRPTIARAYDMGGQGFGGVYYAGCGQVFFDFSNGQSVKSVSGTLYVVPEGNNLIFTFCHAKFGLSNWGASQTFRYNYTYGRIVCPN